MCFQINIKYSHDDQCVKYRIINKAIKYILSIDTFEKNVLLQFLRLEDNMKTIGIEQSLSNRPSVEHTCLNNTKKINQHAGKCDDQQNLKDILDADMVYTP